MHPNMGKTYSGQPNSGTSGHTSACLVDNKIYSLGAEIVSLKSQLQEIHAEQMLKSMLNNMKSMLNKFHQENTSLICVVNHCFLYVSLDWRLEFGPDMHQTKASRLC